MALFERQWRERADAGLARLMTVLPGPPLAASRGHAWGKRAREPKSVAARVTLWSREADTGLAQPGVRDSEVRSEGDTEGLRADTGICGREVEAENRGGWPFVNAVVAAGSWLGSRGA